MSQAQTAASALSSNGDPVKNVLAASGQTRMRTCPPHCQSRSGSSIMALVNARAHCTSKTAVTHGAMTGTASRMSAPARLFSRGVRMREVRCFLSFCLRNERREKSGCLRTAFCHKSRAKCINRTHADGMDGAEQTPARARWERAPRVALMSVEPLRIGRRETQHSQLCKLRASAASIVSRRP